MKHLPLAVLVTLLAVSDAAAQAFPGPQPPVIVTSGEAVLKRAPDRAWLTVSTEARDVNAAEARRKNAEAMTAAQAALKGAGVEAAAIRTQGVSLTPEMDYNNGRTILRGYVARNQVEVRVDNLDRLPAILDAVNSPKGIALSVNGPRFDLKDQASADNEALRQAVEMAMSRAQAIAAGAKRTVGQILRIEDQPGPQLFPLPQPMYRTAAAGIAAAPETPVTPGEVEVRARVTLTVELR